MMLNPTIKCAEQIIGKDYPVFIVAELSANHQHNLEIAEKTIQEIAKSGANAVKIQTYTPDTMTIPCNNPYFQITNTKLWDDKTLYELYQEAYTPWEWHNKLQKIAYDNKLHFFSTPFDITSLEFLQKMDVPLYKIASFEITDIPLIEKIAETQKPIILSSGIAEQKDLDLAVETIRSKGNNQIALLKCTSSYPTPLSEVNLRMIKWIEERYQCVTGISDHTLSETVAISAIALGASIVEKHFILDKSLGGPDCAFSLEPHSFKNMVKNIRETESILGSKTPVLSDSAKEMRKFSRSLFVVKEVKKGERFTSENIRSIRPGYGMPPKYLKEMLGKKAITNIPCGTPLQKDLAE